MNIINNMTDSHLSVKGAVKNKPDSIAKVNRLPRLFAVYSYILLLWSSIGNEILNPPLVFLFILSLAWPFLAFWLACLMGTKRQEIINMYIDTIFSAAFCLVVPNPMVIFSVVIVLFSNALFIGSFQLLARIIVIFLCVTIPLFFVLDAEFVEISTKSRTIIMIFLIAYFSFIAFMSCQLLRQFLALNKKVHELSIKDPLTGSYNRLYLDKELPREINRCMRMEYPMVLIFADIDHFKKINDTLGHSAGDKILKEFVTILNDCIREEFDWVARFGGEEFIIVLANSNTTNGVMVAERIRESIEKYNFIIDGKNIKVTSSFGISGVDDFDKITDAATLLSNADEALYTAKENGRNRVEKMFINP